MSEPVSHEPKWHWHAAPSEKDGTGRRLRALTTKPPGVMAGFVEDNWSQECEKLQHGRDFLWTSKEPRIGQRIELNCTAPSDKFFRMSGMLTAVDNSPPPPGVLPPIMPHCHDKEDHTYDYHYEAFGNTHYFAKANGLAVLSFDFWPGVSGGDVRPMDPNAVYAVEITCDWTSPQSWLLTGMHLATEKEHGGMDAHEWRYEHLAHENEECVCEYGDPSLCLRSEKCRYIHLRKHDPRDDPRDD